MAKKATEKEPQEKTAAKKTTKKAAEPKEKAAPKKSAEAKSKAVAKAPAKTAKAKKPKLSPEAIEEQVRVTAYCIWEQRGCPEGTHEQDWIEAERIVRQ